MKKHSDKTIKYYDEIAESYINSNVAVVLKNEIDEFIKLLSGKKVLDVACGPGHDVSYLNKKGLDCIGIDLSKEMIKLAKKNSIGKFKIMDIFNLKFNNNSFNGLWCSSIFVHIDKKDVMEVISNLRMILMPEGVIGIITAEKQKRIKDKADIRKYTMYNKKEFEDYLIKNDFNILVSKTIYHGGAKGRKKRLFIIARKKDNK